MHSYDVECRIDLRPYKTETDGINVSVFIADITGAVDLEGSIYTAITMYKILLIGHQGSGRGRRRNCSKLHIPRLQWDSSCAMIASGSDLGKGCRVYEPRGDLVTDAMAIGSAWRNQTKDGYLLDGYPRNEGQYNEFSFETPTCDCREIPRGVFEAHFRSADARVRSDLCDEGRVPIGDACKCGGKLMQRDDETPGRVVALRSMRARQKPIIETYEREGLVRRVNGVNSVEEIYERVESAR